MNNEIADGAGRIRAMSNELFPHDGCPDFRITALAAKLPTSSFAAVFVPTFHLNLTFSGRGVPYTAGVFVGLCIGGRAPRAKKPGVAAGLFASSAKQVPAYSLLM
jgi:hypothetical protein